MISTRISGYSVKSRATAGARIVSEACSTDVMRRLPAGFPRMAVTAANPASIPSKCGATVWIRRFARLGRRDATRVAGQEPQSQPAFRLPNDAAEGGLRYAELRRSPRKAPFPCDRQQGDQVVDGLARHLCVHVISP